MGGSAAHKAVPRFRRPGATFSMLPCYAVMTTMNWSEYLAYTRDLLTHPNPPSPYDNPDYFHYTKMNETRMRRWLKTDPINAETRAIVEQLNQPQRWIVITEPWCGDAAHIVPILYLMSQLNANIQFELQLRDHGSEIDRYLTNGSKSIPILIVLDERDEDLFHWGPRPREGQQMYLDLVARQSDFEVIKNAIQTYYNADRSLSTQKEVSDLLRQTGL